MKDLRIVLSLGAAMLACAGGAAAAGSALIPPRNTPMVLDWSTRQAAFRNPETPEQARARGNFARWQRLASDPRYMHALAGKLQAQDAAAAKQDGSRLPRPANDLSRDWSNVMGGGEAGLGGSGIRGVYPAKFSFDINAIPSCTRDFVVFPTGSPGASVSGTRERWVADFDTSHSAGTLTLGDTPPRMVTIIGNTTRNDGVYAKTGGAGPLSASTIAENVAAAVNRFTGKTGFTALAEGPQVTVTLDTAGDQVITYANENLTNFGPWANTNGTPSPGMPSIIAFNQLYDGTCSLTRRAPLAPNVMWSYNTGGTVRTSPVLSYFDDGRQVAFVQRNSGGQAELVLVKWQDEADGRPSLPTVPKLAATAADYRAGTGACVGSQPCMYKIPLGSADDSWSSPFVDYSGDVLYVGTNDGVLHKVTGVFAGQPAQVVTGGFPATVSPGNALSSPVYDFNGSVFVGSASAVGSGGALHRVNTSTGAVVSSAKLTADSVNPGLRSMPMLDVYLGRVYAFLFNDGGAAGTNCTLAPCRAVVEFATNFAAGTAGNKARIGSGASTTRVQYIGGFDSAWLNSVDSTGAMYVCGGLPEDPARSVLWKIPVTGGSLGTPIAGAPVSAFLGAECSPVTLVRNGIDEFLFLSMSDDGVDAGAVVCSGACVYMFNLHDLGGTAKEQWTFEFTGNQTANAGTLIVGDTTLSPGNTQACPVFNIGSGPAVSDAASLAACVNTVPGFSANQTRRRVVITSEAFVNVSDLTVREGANINNLSQLLDQHVDGADGSAWGPSNAPIAGFPAIGGAGGIIIDNISTLPGTSQIYFANIGPLTGNATQVSQSSLE